MGIGPTQPAWEAGVLPLNYACMYLDYTTESVCLQIKITHMHYIKLILLLHTKYVRSVHHEKVFGCIYVVACEH